MRSIILITR